MIEIHGAHGYLIHEFLSPSAICAQTSTAVRSKIAFASCGRIIGSVRAAIPESTPLFPPHLGNDWIDGAWDLEQSCALVEAIKNDGVTLIDVSSGGNAAKARIPMGPGYQTAFAAENPEAHECATGAVGAIHLTRTGRSHREIRSGRPGASRARDAARSVLGRGARRRRWGRTSKLRSSTDAPGNI